MPKPNVKRGEVSILHQVAALPLRKKQALLEVCLVTTREIGRWTVPKGWPMKGRKDYMAAKIEAEQEAGVTGNPDKRPFGTFTYWKRRDAHFDLVRVDLYPLWVTKILSTWKEQTERQVKWVTLSAASMAVDEPELSALLIKAETLA